MVRNVVVEVVIVIVGKMGVGNCIGIENWRKNNENGVAEVLGILRRGVVVNTDY